MATRFAKKRSELPALLLGLLFGFGINLLTADPQRWWTPLRLVYRYVEVWLPAAVLVVAGWEFLQRYRWRRSAAWRGVGGPYPGLEAFAADRASVFFGREEEARDIIELLSKGGVSPSRRFIPLVGASGSGKSSVIQAGVIPRLGGSWKVLGPLRPGADPFLSVADVLTPRHSMDTSAGIPRPELVARRSRLLRDEALSLRGEDTNRPKTLLALLVAARASQERLLIVVDQWEELETLAPKADAEAFQRLVYRALSAEPRLRVLAAVRPEFLQSLSSGPCGDLFTRPFSIGPLRTSGVREAIMGPASAAGFGFEPGLVEMMVAEATIGDALPLLAHLLRRLSEDLNPGAVITFQDYNRVGRVGGAIAAHADGVYESLVAAYNKVAVDQTLLRFILLDGRDPSLRSVKAGDLDATAIRIVQEFRAARLIVDTHDGTTYELAHEALLRHWGVLAQLVASHENQLRLLSVLQRRAEAWATDQDTDDLLRGRVLAEATELATRYPPSTTMSDFLTASRANSAAQLQSRADQVAEAAQQLRSQDRGLAIALAWAAAHELSCTETTLLTLWGLQAEPSTYRLAAGHTDNVTSMTWLSNPTRLMTASRDGSVCIWDSTASLVDTRFLPFRATGETLLSPNGRRLLVREDSQDSQDRISLWDAEDTRHIATGISHQYGLEHHAWSPSARLLASGLGHSGITIWSLGDEDDGPKVTWRVTSSFASRVEWSTDETMLALELGTCWKIFDVSTKCELLTIETSSLTSYLAWAPGNQAVAVIHKKEKKRDQTIIDSRQATVVIYSVPAAESVAARETAASGVMAWSPNAKNLAIATSRNTKHYVELWEPSTNVVIRRRRVKTNVTQISWSTDPSLLAFSDRTGSVAIWNLATNRISRGYGGSIQEVSWSPDRGRAVVRASWSPSRIIGKSASVMIISRASKEVGGTAVAWSPRATLIAEGSGNIVTTWDFHQSRYVVEVGQEEGTIRHLTWSPDGKSLAVLVADWWERHPNSIFILDGESGQVITELEGDETKLGPLEWAPSGTLIAGQGGPNVVHVWDPLTGKIYNTIRVPADKSTALTWSTNSQHLIVANDDFKVRTADVRTGQEMSICVGHTAPIRHLSTQPEGRLLASIGLDDSLRIWDYMTGAPKTVVDTPRHSRIVDLWWHADRQTINATTSSGVILTWSLPVNLADLHIAEENARKLSPAERERFGLPLISESSLK